MKHTFVDANNTFDYKIRVREIVSTIASLKNSTFSEIYNEINKLVECDSKNKLKNERIWQ